MLQWLRSLIFTVFVFTWIFSCGVAFAFMQPFMPFVKRWRLANFCASGLVGAARLLCGLGYKVEGLENIPPGAHVALWKHSSSWETFAMMVIFPQQVWVLKRELLLVPFVGWTLAMMGAIAINRSAGSSAVTQVLEQGRKRLAMGSWVIIFPEGTRMPAGETRKYGASGALLASRTGCKVVPVAHDAGFFWPRRGLLKKPGTITVRIGKPIEAAGRDPRDINREAQEWIEAQIAALAK